MSSKLYAIVGPNGSGKSSVIRSTELDIVCPFIINPDNFARCIKDVDDETERCLSVMRPFSATREEISPVLSLSRGTVWSACPTMFWDGSVIRICEFWSEHGM